MIYIDILYPKLGIIYHIKFQIHVQILVKDFDFESFYFQFQSEPNFIIS